MFNFEVPGLAKAGRNLEKVIRWNLKPCKWGCSSAGRAPALHAGGQEFDPPHLHQQLSEKGAHREEGEKSRTDGSKNMGA